jgi:hypothetical protein
MNEYKVGQVLYKISQEGIVPILVKEEITKVTLAGTVKSYIFLYHQRDVESTSVKDTLFENLDDVKEFLLDKAKNHIQKLVVSAKTSAIEWYKLDESSFQKKNVLSSQIPTIDVDDPALIEENEEVLVTLPDGTVAKYRPKKLE